MLLEASGFDMPAGEPPSTGRGRRTADSNGKREILKPVPIGLFLEFSLRADISPSDHEKLSLETLAIWHGALPRQSGGQRMI